MDKLVFLFGRVHGMSVDEFRDHYLQVHAPSALERTRAMHGYVVNLVEHDTTTIDDAGVAGAQPTLAVDAVTEIWTPSIGEFLDPATAFTSPEAAEAHMADHNSFIGPMHVYRVEERVVKARSTDQPVGARTPGVKYMSLMDRADGMSHDEFVAYWRDRHAPLAVEHHVGMTGYVQNVVVEALSPDAPAIDGFVEMYFPTADDFQHRFFDSPAGRDAIMADAYTFIAPSTVSLIVDEHVFASPARSRTRE
jgi:uncharacterized protein (TIGR02118 family)